MLGSEHEGSVVKVRSARNKEGFISGLFICKTGTTTRPFWDQTELRESATHPIDSGKTQSSPSNSGSLILKVLQTEHVPYTVPAGGGQTNTNCSIRGTVDTQGSTTTKDNFINWTAYSYPHLHMDCSSVETSPIGWRHVPSAMLVVASDGNAYIIACDAAWRWSKCKGLMPGDRFQARWSQGGLTVSYHTDKGEEKEAAYAVLASKSLKN